MVERNNVAPRPVTYILYLAFTEIGDPIRTLMLGSPPDLDSNGVIDAMRGVPGVQDVHHVDLWQMQEHEAALDCHVLLTAEGWARIEAIKTEIKARLQDRFGITHSSLEFEHVDYAHNLPTSSMTVSRQVEGGAPCSPKR